MSLNETAFTQTRQLMASKLPEYRPFALQEIVRAATFEGGGRKSKPQSTPFNMPAWLDIFLYCTVAFVVGAAFFMGMYATMVRPYEIHIDDDGEVEIYKLAASQDRAYQTFDSEVLPSLPAPGPKTDHARVAPHPPPPMLPMS